MKELPQIIKETWISGDYWNEYWGLEVLLDCKEGVSLVTTSIRETPIKKYGERYPLTEYDNVINEKNRERISRLDEIAERVNSTMTDPATFRADKLRAVLNEVNMLIYGRRR